MRWYERALCKGMDVERWFPRAMDFGGRPNQRILSELRGICASCPVRRECLDDVMAYEASSKRRYGFVAGLLPTERLALMRRNDEQSAR